MKTKISIISLVCLLGFISCEKEEKIVQPQQPQLSCGTSLTIVEGETSAEITISNGIAPYTTVQQSNRLQVTFISDTKFTLTALSVGNEILTIKGSDRGETQLSVVISPDPDKAFKEDATVRVEKNGTVFTPLDHTFVVDKGGSLLGSSQVKVGSTLDGNTYTLIGWDPGEGHRNPKLYTQEGVIPLSNLQMLQEKEGKIWLIGTSPSLTIKVCTEF